MDNTNIDFEYSIEQIKRPIVTDYNMQQIYLNSKDINNGFKNMENSLKKLKATKKELEEQIRLTRLAELDDIISEKGLSFEEVKELLNK